MLLASALTVAALAGAASLLVALAFGGYGGPWAAVIVGGSVVATLAGISAAVVAIGALHTVVQPLEAVAEAAVRLADGPYLVRLPGASGPEMRAIAAALAEAAADLHARQEELDGTRSAFRQALSRLGEVLASTHDFEGIVDAIVETALLVVPADAAVFYRLAASPDHLEAWHARGVAPGEKLLAGGGLAGAAARSHAVTILSNPAELDAAEPRAIAAIAAPLHSLGRLVGVLAVYGTTVGRPFSAEETELLVSLLRQVEVAVVNIELHERARRDALTDGVTGLWNRRHFDLRLQEAVASAQRYGEDFSVAMFDLDDFKRVNDTWDHFTGDAALVHFAGLLRTATREVDVACRWGGEEFAVLLQRAGPVAAATIAQRVVELVRTTPLARGGQDIGLTVSAGVASFPSDGSDGEQVLARADAALLRAKAAGKDRVERASSPTDTALVVDVTEGGRPAVPGGRLRLS
jgi:diguanylate cyclase (GGDEF)-like protein